MERMKRGFQWGVLGLILAVTAGCVFVVLSPEPMLTNSQDFELTGNNQVRIVVVFSRNVDLSSVMPQENVIVDTETDSNVEISVVAGANANEIIITTVSPIGDICSFDPDCSFSLMLIGSGGSPIMDTSGMTLDGDGDGNPGGNYETGFLVLG